MGGVEAFTTRASTSFSTWPILLDLPTLQTVSGMWRLLHSGTWPTTSPRRETLSWRQEQSLGIHSLRFGTVLATRHLKTQTPLTEGQGGCTGFASMECTLFLPILLRLLVLIERQSLMVSMQAPTKVRRNICTDEWGQPCCEVTLPTGRLTLPLSWIIS